jgi:transposase-like protein
MRAKDRYANKMQEGGPKAGPYVKKRQTVFGMVERGGKVRAVQVRSRYGYTLRNNIREHVLPSSLVYTDEYSGYSGIERKYTHRRINHGEKVYVSGDVHTQTIEGFFSTLKNGIRGVYHSVSAKWLQGYLNEYAWRYNHRDEPGAMFKKLLLRATFS